MSHSLGSLCWSDWRSRQRQNQECTLRPPGLPHRSGCCSFGRQRLRLLSHLPVSSRWSGRCSRRRHRTLCSSGLPESPHWSGSGSPGRLPVRDVSRSSELSDCLRSHTPGKLRSLCTKFPHSAPASQEKAHTRGPLYASFHPQRQKYNPAWHRCRRWSGYPRRQRSRSDSRRTCRWLLQSPQR